MKKILINHNLWQTRIATTRDGRLENVYFSTHAQEVLERAYFKGVITKILPGIQTAFVDIGQERAGFLHISEIDRDLVIRRMSKTTQIEEDEKVKKVKQQRTDISKVFNEGDEILVQVSKEPVYEKGAKLTTCFTLPGRFIVLMPNIPRLGVSKKIEDLEERNRLKDIVRKQLPEGMGCIIRTTSEGRESKEIVKDLNFLLKTWREIEKNYAKAKPQEKIHEDLDLSLQIVRDFLDDDVEAVITNDKNNQKEIYRFVKIIAPEHSQKIKLYDGQIPLFDNYDIESQIEDALQKKVELKSGGSLIIETAEAMTVIDVNTGKFTGKGSLEETIFKTNLEAAEEVARQLRLRNIGGLIVIDFIDMGISANRQKLFRHFEKILRERDKFQSVVLKVSEFGLVQMTRKRSGKTLIQQLMDSCFRCKGSGVTKSLQTESFAILRDVKHALKTEKFDKEISIGLHPDVFNYVTTVEYNTILELERQAKAKITLVSDKRLVIHEYTIEKK